MHLITTDQIQRARQRVHDDPAARKLADAVFAAAAAWLARDDAQIRALLPEAGVPRTWSINYVTGCPVHGSGPEGYRGYAQGGWRYDPFADRWRVTCALGGEVYPSNDFERFYRTGMQDRSLLTGPYADDGWGWLGPGAFYRHWFVAYCCEHLWQTVVSGLTALSRAYLLGGGGQYAHKALVILDRLAEVYPQMDYSTQSMYAAEFSPGYDGKMFNLISETGNAAQLCKAVDAVRDAIPADPLFGATAESTRGKIERGIIGAALEGIYGGKVRGNYGMHQEALLVAATTSGDQRQIDRAVDWVLHHTGEATLLKEMRACFDGYVFRDKSAHAEGLDFALDNLILREGMGWESSPSYNASWVGHIAAIAALLQRLGVRIWDRPKVRRMLRWPTQMCCLNQFTPAIGDAGGPTGGLVQLSAGTLRTAWLGTCDPFVGELLRQRRPGLDGFEDLFEEVAAPGPSPEAAAQIRRLKESPRLMGGYGLALLRAGRGRERCAVSLYYGRAATEHAHFDRLNIELFAYGKKLIPDHGYPEHAAEGDGPAVWTKNTLSHTTVVVDGRRQDTQGPGRLVLFTAAPGLGLAEVDAAETYHSVAEYRRTVALVELAPDARYLLDLFRVAGGSQHDYSMHGFAGEFSTAGLALGEVQTRGTLTGEEVPYGAIYDDEELANPYRKGRSYYTYRGGGYSYLYDVQRGCPAGPWSATWHSGEVGLRAHFLPSGEAIVAHGEPPRKPGNPRHFTYVLLRNAGDGTASQFAMVAEPFQGTPRVRAVEEVGRTAQTIDLRIAHRHGTDVIGHAVEPAGSRFSLVRRDPDGRLERLHLTGVGHVQADGVTLTIARGLRGRVVAVDPESAAVEIELDRGSQSFGSRLLMGAAACIGNDRRQAAYTITGVEGQGRRRQIRFGDDSFRIGRFAVTGRAADGSGVSTRTNLYLASQGYYRGARLVDGEHRHWLPVEDVRLAPHRPGWRRDAQIALVGKHDLSAFAPEEVAHLYDFGPGDSISVVPHATAARAPDGGFRVKGNCRALLST
ncbi:MAG: heparinase II/III family protein [Candidatus Latescibacterota bacterium]